VKQHGLKSMRLPQAMMSFVVWRIYSEPQTSGWKRERTMSDLPMQLRHLCCFDDGEAAILCCRAADEIERLRTALATGDREDCCGEIKRWQREEIERLRTEIERLRAVVAKLPHTADGVPVVPGMVVWTAYWSGPRKEVVAEFVVQVDKPTIWASGLADVGQLYSTKEAAEAARGGSDGS